MVGFNGDLLVGHFAIDGNCAQLFEDTTSCHLTHHGSLLGIVFADAVIWELNIIVNCMYKTVRGDHAQDLAWCHFDLCRLVRRRRQALFASRQSGHDVASGVGTLVVTNDDHFVLGRSNAGSHHFEFIDHSNRIAYLDPVALTERTTVGHAQAGQQVGDV